MLNEKFQGISHSFDISLKNGLIWSIDPIKRKTCIYMYLQGIQIMTDTIERVTNR